MNNNSTIQKRTRRKSSEEHYIDNKRFFDEMCLYIDKFNKAKEENIKLPIVPNYIGECIVLIATKLSLSRSFSGYSFIDEMVGYGIENCLQYLDKFKPFPTKPSKITGKIEQGNPLAYFTRVIHFAFIRKIYEEEKNNYIKHKLLINASIKNDLESIAADDRFHINTSFSEMGIDRSSDIIGKFEKRMKLNKEKQIEKRKFKEMEDE